MRVIRTNAKNADFISLVRLLDTDLAHRDGADHNFYTQFNAITSLAHVVIGYDNDQPVACGAFRFLDDTTVEIKRMYTLPGYRRKGLAGKILTALETWAIETGAGKCILETGKKQPEAIHLYKKSGYRIIPNYGQYAGIENSRCFEKNISLQLL